MRLWLKEQRKKAGLSSKEIAIACGVSYAHYNFIESGKRRPSPELAQKLGKLIGFDWRLFYEDENKAG